MWERYKQNCRVVYRVIASATNHVVVLWPQVGGLREKRAVAGPFWRYPSRYMPGSVRHVASIPDCPTSPPGCILHSPILLSTFSANILKQRSVL